MVATNYLGPFALTNYPPNQSSGPSSALLQSNAYQGANAANLAGSVSTLLQDKIHWWPPFKMMLLFLLGTVAAVGHHFYYNSFQGTEVGSVTSQEWVIRGGNIFAWFVSYCLVAAIACAYAAYVWTVVRRKPITMAGLDAVFSAATDMFSMFSSIELYTKVPLGAILATMIWVSPLASVATPGTLSVIPLLKTNITAIKAPILNLTDSNVAGNSNALYYGMRTPILQRMFKATYIGANILSMPAAFPDAANATYEATFHGPAMRCQTTNAKETAIMLNIVNATEQHYVAKRGAVKVPYLSVPPSQFFYDQNGNINTTFDFASFARYCVVGNNPKMPLCSNPGHLADGLFWLYNDGSSWKCLPQNATLVANFEVGLQQRQTIHIQEEKTQYQAITASTQTSESSTYYQILGAFQSIINGAAALSIAPVNATKDGSNRTVYMEKTLIADTALFGALNLGKTFDALSSEYDPNDLYVTPADVAMTRNRTIDRLVQDLSLNLTLGFFSMKQFWSTPDYATNLTQPFYSTQYSYNSFDLFLSYIVAIGVSPIAMLLGIWSFWKTGVAQTLEFSTILQTTRNKELDTLVLQGSQGHCTGIAPLRKDLKKQKLQFGMLDWEGDSFSHVAFGFPKDITPLDNGR